MAAPGAPLSAAAPAGDAADRPVGTSDTVGDRAVRGHARRVGGGLLVLLVALAVYGTSAVRARADSRLSTLVALSALHDGDLRLDEYAAVVNAQQPYLRDVVGGHIVSAYPVATPLLVLPFVAADDLLERLRGRPSPSREAAAAIPEDTEFRVAVAVCALGLLAMYGVGLALRLRVRWAVVFALGFGLCTSMWSVSSRGLWPQTTSMLALVLLLLLAVTRERLEGAVVGADPVSADGEGRADLVEAKDRWWGLALGATVASLVMIRPTHALAVLPVLYVRRFSVRRVRLRAASGFAAVAIPLLVATRVTYGTLFPRYNGMTVADMIRYVRPSRVPNALAAILVSPNRGLFSFTPVLLLAVPVLVAVRRRRDRRAGGASPPLGDRLVLACAWSFAAATAVYAVWPVYWGGHSYGPRLLSDAVPFAWFPLAFLGRLWPARRRVAAALVVGALAAVSLAVHGYGARSWKPDEWNVVPRDIDEFPGRVWSVRDLQVLRGVDLPGARWFQPPPCRSVAVPPADAGRVVARRAPSQRAVVGARPGEGVWLRVLAVNGASVALRSCGDAPVNVSYHLLDAGGRMLQFDGNRRRLPRMVRPGTSAETSLQVVAPLEPGRYRVRLALVQEGIRWFDDGPVPRDALVELVVG